MTALDFLIKNRAPDEDSCTIKVLAGYKRLHITIWRDEANEVHICIENNRQDRFDLILGKEGETHRL